LVAPDAALPPAPVPLLRPGGLISETYQQVLVGTPAQWRQWLTQHHHDTLGIWLVTWKKGSGHPRLPYNDIVEEALLQMGRQPPRRIGTNRSALLVTPRKPTSNWSRANKQRVAALTAAGLMHRAGLAAVAAAQANGSWDAQ
jgi:uncharacterized protein YdeI (YjbR/CyaY-like superfamily)